MILVVVSLVIACCLNHCLKSKLPRAHFLKAGTQLQGTERFLDSDTLLFFHPAEQFAFMV